MTVSATRREPGPEAYAGGAQEVLECHVLLPAWQAEALIRVALARGATAGQLVRRLIGEFLDGIEPPPDGGLPGRTDLPPRRRTAER
jgi:hypothetical protein